MTTTSNPWDMLDISFGVNEDSFNDVVSNSQYLGDGLHKNVFIEGLEPAISKAGKPYVRLLWSSDDKQTARDVLFLNSKPDDSGNIHPHFTLRRLISALVDDKSLRMKFMSEVVANKSLFASLVGLRADIKIMPGSSGYTVKAAPAGGHLLWDVEDDSQLSETVFDSYKEAREFAKEAGFKPCYSEIAFINPASDEAAREANDNAIQAVISAKSNPAAAAKASGSGRVPAGTPRSTM